MTILALVAILLVLSGSLSMWGPGNHLEFEQRVFRRRRERLGRETADLIEGHRDAYQYGNIAADIINFKTVGGHYNHCHRWTIIEEMRTRAKTDEERAFILGYLSHLAADTIAHNHFVPYHLARYARVKGLGHLYWEMNADRFVPEERWQVVSRLKQMPELTRLDQLVNQTVPHKALSMSTNKVIFNHVLLVSEREQYRRGIARLHPMGRLKLTKGFLELFRDAAVERIFYALRPDGVRGLAHIDTNGKLAQQKAMRMRRGVLQRLAPGRVRQDQSEELAADFLVGMQTPPPAGANGNTPHW
jgi:Zinc dependent phospholipase C